MFGCIATGNQGQSLNFAPRFLGPILPPYMKHSGKARQTGWRIIFGVWLALLALFAIGWLAFILAPVVIGVSTNGAAPILAQNIRRRFYGGGIGRAQLRCGIHLSWSGFLFTSKP